MFLDYIIQPTKKLQMQLDMYLEDLQLGYQLDTTSLQNRYMVN